MRASLACDIFLSISSTSLACPCSVPLTLCRFCRISFNSRSAASRTMLFGGVSVILSNVASSRASSSPSIHLFISARRASSCSSRKATTTARPAAAVATPTLFSETSIRSHPSPSFSPTSTA
ncbi:hypothetical protein CH063_08923, partial [Colletotrichum higginsianum]